ncbi:MAG: hypothetical protein H7144_01865 [Burkholderiales bacterium]|nr:hypothetical protein [Phycisphaerae bacterium]
MPFSKRLIIIIVSLCLVGIGSAVINRELISLTWRDSSLRSNHREVLHGSIKIREGRMELYWFWSDILPGSYWPQVSAGQRLLGPTHFGISVVKRELFYISYESEDKGFWGGMNGVMSPFTWRRSLTVPMPIVLLGVFIFSRLVLMLRRRKLKGRGFSITQPTGEAPG